MNRIDKIHVIVSLDGCSGFGFEDFSAELNTKILYQVLIEVSEELNHPIQEKWYDMAKGYFDDE
ncbi:hypothetical protein [Robiginitalea aurantiaca]|uniref:Uncharacterized protein n=1 Tax=Robiginitalea aurantiaca TaxID=3056915 RepID=A0ABT7WBE3_9FLAO|nr:hypothetical protein [Robiginitalea aurantiaca]MDM9630239.1 hypothetical protein [Robiginitalea aurantiaca]